MLAPNHVGIARSFKTERRIVGHGIRGRQQYQGHVVADDGPGAPDKFLADAQALVLLVYRQVREIAAVGIIGQRAGQPHELAIHPCRQQQAGRGKHARDPRQIGRRPLDARLVEDANDIDGVQGEIVTIFYGQVFHGLKSTA